MAFISGTEQLALPRIKGNWLIDRLIPLDGLSAIQGEPKVGKSLFMLQLAEAVSTGKSHFLDLPISAHGKVAFIQLDTPRSVWQHDVELLAKWGLDFSNVQFIDRSMADVPWPFTLDEHHEWLRKELDRIDPIWVIADVMRELHSGDENDSLVMKKFFTAWNRALNHRAGSLLAHGKKPSAMGLAHSLMSGLRGSSQVAGKVDCLMLLLETRLIQQSRALAATETACHMIKGKGVHREALFILDTEDDEKSEMARALSAEHPTLPSTDLADLLFLRWNAFVELRPEQKPISSPKGARDQLTRLKKKSA